ncbi:MAG: diguanylate cyclase domain-containing protein [Thermosynechococcaceae cyanobacterium]
MAQLHDYTQTNWGDEATLEASLEQIHGEMIGLTPLKVGDEIVLCLRCRVDAVESLSSQNNPQTFKTQISFIEPVPVGGSADTATPQFLHQIVQQLGTSIQQSGLFQQIERSRSIDPITHTAVRARLNTRLEQEWQRMGHHQTPLVLVLGEVDQLEAYRQTYGEFACDDCLRQLVKAINASASRSGDLVARYQGSTLAILLPNTSLDAAICVAKKIRWRIKSLRIGTEKDDLIHRFTMSLGISCLIPDRELRPKNLVAGAEASLRQAQRAGGDKIIWQEGRF